MKESKYIGNFSNVINCDRLINHLKSQQGDIRNSDNPYGANGNVSERIAKEKENMRSMWIDAGYNNSNSVEWINFYLGTHFDTDVVDIFSKQVNARPHNVWISSMKPGKCIPNHWDIILDYEQYEHDPSVVRYSFFIDKPQIGKVFILKDEPYHNIEQGSVYQWNKWDEWHLGFNCGLTQKYLFHYIGFKIQ
jgi:hypothetical protein